MPMSSERSAPARNVTVEELNLLQDVGLISDNCVDWSDVAECDRGPALYYLDTIGWKKLMCDGD